jgi:hypothetical protein
VISPSRERYHKPAAVPLLMVPPVQGGTMFISCCNSMEFAGSGVFIISISFLDDERVTKMFLFLNKDIINNKQV